MVELSADEARRLQLGAQGFGDPRAGGTLAKVRKLASRLGAYQIDSVNVLVRAHYMPAFSRLGPYDMSAIEKLAYDKREFFEYFAHAACYVPMSMHPLLRWRMETAAGADWYGGATKQVRGYIESVYDFVADNGPVAASDVPKAGKSSGNWWGWSDGKRAIETLFRVGRVTVSGRQNFKRLYDVPERVIPPDVLRVPTPDADEAKKQLLVHAAKALGVGTASCIAGYFYIESWWDRPHVKGKKRKPGLKRLFAELVEEGRLEPASVEGWKEPAYVVGRPRVPKQMHARALVSPFDPIMWNRLPTSRVFGFDYQIEIYVPAPKRVYGYYCLPLLVGDRFVGRVDLKADRKTSTLLVPAAHAEPGHDKHYVASELAEELRLMSSWLGLEAIVVGDRGDLAKPLARELKARGVSAGSPKRAAGAKTRAPASRAGRR